MRRRVFAVALHGFGPYYTEPFMRDGALPALAGVLAGGSSRALLAPYPISAAAWVTLFTGQSVGVHGVLDYVQVDARSYHGTRARLAGSASYADDTIFSILSRHGRRVAAVFLPMTYPPWPVNGVMVSGFPLPDERRPPTWPPDLSARLGPIADRRLLRFRYEDKDGVEAYLSSLLARLEEVTLELWRDGDLDLMCTCIPAPDLAHHYFWARDDRSAWERIRRVYERVDRTLGRYAAALGDDDVLVVFSDHGGGPAPSRMLSVTRWLADAGLLRLRSGAVDRQRLADATNRMVQLGRRLRLHQTLRRWLRGPVRERVLSLTHNDAFVDFRATRAYGVEFFYPLAGVEVNLAGRQESGVVSPGAAYERVRDEVCERLSDLADPARGVRVCRRVCRREELFHGPHLDRIPDVVAVLDRDYDGKVQLHRDAIADNALNWEYPFMGYHAQEGVLAIRGAGVAAGKVLAPGHMIDLAPTLLRLLDVPAPAAMEGTAMADFGL